MQPMMQGSGQDGLQQTYYTTAPGVGQPIMSVYGGPAMQMAPQPMASYAPAQYAYNSVLASAPSPPASQGGYFNAQGGPATFVLHNSGMPQPSNMFLTGGNAGYFPMPYNAGSGLPTAPGGIALSAVAPQQQQAFPHSQQSLPSTMARAQPHQDGFQSNQAQPWGGMTADPLAGGSHFEVHDTHLKTPIPVSRNVVVPTNGSERLFHPRGKDSDAQRSRTMLRVCEPFVEGTCTSAERCSDVHVYPDYVQTMRQQLSSWLADREREFNTIRSTNPDKTFRVFVADLKEVVDIPVASLAFTKGLYVDPATRARRTRGTVPQGRGNIATAQVPTGCGLYSTDPANCKWGRWCNQVHISKAWMNTRKQEFDQWFTKLEDNYVDMPSEHIFVVHDPQSKLNLEIPKYAISGFTRGLFQGSERKAPSVCLLFQRGRCTAAACCNQIHVDHTFLELGRQKSVYCNEHSGEDPSTPSPQLAEIEQQLKSLRRTLLVKEAEEIRRLTEEASHRRRESTKSAQDVDAVGRSSRHASKHENSESPMQAGLIEHIAVDDDDDDVAPLRLTNDRATRPSAAAIRHPNGSYTNNPYGSITSVTEDKSANSSILSLGGLVITPSRPNTAGTGAPMSVTVQQRSSSSFSRTPAASMTAINGGGKRGSYGKGPATHNYFEQHAEAPSLFFNASNNSYSSPAAAGYGTSNQALHHEGSSGPVDPYYPGFSMNLQSTEDTSLHFSASQLGGVNGSTVSFPKSGAIAQQPENVGNRTQ